MSWARCEESGWGGCMQRDTLHCCRGLLFPPDIIEQSLLHSHTRYFKLLLKRWELVLFVIFRMWWFGAVIILDAAKIAFLNTLRLLCRAYWLTGPHIYFFTFLLEKKENEVFEYRFHFGTAWIIMLCDHHLGNGYYIEPDGFLPWKAYENILSHQRHAC